MTKKHSKQKSSPRQDAASAIIQAVENQLAANDPPEVLATLNRLITQGQPREIALKLIASALIIEIFGAIAKDQAYNSSRYIKNLHALPRSPIE